MDLSAIFLIRNRFHVAVILHILSPENWKQCSGVKNSKAETRAENANKFKYKIKINKSKHTVWPTYCWRHILQRYKSLHKHHSLHMPGFASAGRFCILSLFAKHTWPLICCALHGNHKVHSRDGTGQHFCSPTCPELTRKHNLFSGPDRPVIYRNLESKVTTLKCSVHCPLDNKTM